jgi:hypothetical protein
MVHVICFWKALVERYIWGPKVIENLVTIEKAMYSWATKKRFWSPYIWQLKTSFGHHLKHVDH